MSFGFSIGDIFAVGQLAWSVYKSCKGAGGAFAEVSHEVISLHTAIKELEDETQNPDSIFNRTGAGKKKELGVLVQNCNGVLQQLNKLLIKYKSLGTGSKRAWDRLRWGTENLAEIREKIMSHTSSLTLFLTTLSTGSLGRIEKKLDQLIEDVRAGRREETVLTMADNDEDEAEIQWNLWKSELVDDGFTRVELEANKHWIKARLMELIESGGLHEEPLPEKGSASKSRSPNHPKDAAPGAGNISQNLKQSHTGVPTTKNQNLQSYVEDAEDEGEDNEIRGNETFDSQESRHPGSKGLSREEAAREDRGEKSNQDFPSQEIEESDVSDSTEDTFLPSDSISNIGINIAETRPVPDTRTPQPLPSTTKKSSRPKGKTDPPPNLRQRSSNRGSPPSPPPPPPPLQGKSGDPPQTTSGGFNHYEFSTGDDSENKNKTRRKQARTSADIPGKPESEYLERPKYQGQYEPPDMAQPSTNNYPSAPRRERSYDELKYNESSRRDYRSNEANQTLPRKYPPSDDDYYDSDPSDVRRPYSRRVFEEPLQAGHRVVRDPIYDSRRVHNLPSRPLDPYIDPKDDPYFHPRDRRYIDPRDDQYLDPRVSRGTSTPTQDPRYFVPGNKQGSNYPPRSGPSDGYPPTNSNPTDPDRSRTFDSSRGFAFSNPEQIFSEFLRRQGDMGNTNGTNDDFANFGPDTGRRGPIPRAPTPKVTIVERPLPLTLEEVFNGTHKKMKIKRKAFDEITGKWTTQDRILEMDIKPGLKKGSKIKFKGVGDQEEAGQQDLHFITEDKKHPLFTREGNDLHLTVELDLRESLCGWNRIITTIDGKQLNIEKQGPTQPGSCEKYPNLGMPLSKAPSKRGDFIVTCAVKYPTSLTPWQRSRLREVLGEIWG